MPEETLVRLIAPPGCDQASIGTTRYPVHDDGCILVPASAVPALTTIGGFALAPVQPALPDDETALSEEAAAAFGADPEI
jgi:hypothetical protein